MPAAAVIPAPRAYINVVAVKKPVVGFERSASWAVSGGSSDPTDVQLTLGPRSETCGIVHWPKAH